MAATSAQRTAVASTRPDAARRAWSRHRLSEGITPYLLVAPLMVLIALFIYWPLLYSTYLAFFDWNFVRPEKIFVGWLNFARLPEDPRFIQSLRGTAIYTVALVPLQVLLPLGLALLLWPTRRSRFQNSYRVMLFSPTVIAYSVAAVMWLWIFNPNYGVLNMVLGGFGLDRINWLSDRTTAIWAIIVVATWKTLGFHMLLYLAAFEGVPRDYIEAAQVDGANPWQVMRSIRFPLITPTFFFVLVTTVISANDDVFAAINVLTDGGPYESSTNVVYYLYKQAFEYFQIGSASAVAILVFIATAILTWLQFKYVERHVHYG